MEQQLLEHINNALPFEINGIGNLYEDGTVRKYDSCSGEYVLIKQDECNNGYIRYTEKDTLQKDTPYCLNKLYNQTTSYRLVVFTKGYNQQDIIQKLVYQLYSFIYGMAEVDIKSIIRDRLRIKKEEMLPMLIEMEYVAIDFQIKITNKTICDVELVCSC